MKTLRCLILSLIVVLAFHSVGRTEEKREERPRFKGVELYSWKGPQGQWLFALLSGTNRLKDEAEVKDPKNQIVGVDELKKALARLAVEEQVSWTHRVNGFEYPPEATAKEIEEFATKVKVTLRRPQGKD
jgi:hypothetical protein